MLSLRQWKTSQYPIESTDVYKLIESHDGVAIVNQNALVVLVIFGWFTIQELNSQRALFIGRRACKGDFVNVVDLSVGRFACFPLDRSAINSACCQRNGALNMNSAPDGVVLTVRAPTL